MEKVKKTFVAMGVAFVVSSLITLIFNESGVEIHSFFSLTMIVLISVLIIMGLDKLSVPNHRPRDEDINKERQ